MSAAEQKPLEWSERASEDLLAIHTHIAQDNRTAADAVVRHLLAVTGELRRFPTLGRPGRRKGTRELILTRYPYLVVYRVTARKVSIITVSHQRRRFP